MFSTFNESPRIILEAASVGTSVIASKIPSHEEISAKLETGVTLVNTNSIEEITQACENMSKSKTGAIIVIEKNSILDSTTNTGRIINSELSSIILESIFPPTTSTAP